MVEVAGVEPASTFLRLIGEPGTVGRFAGRLLAVYYCRSPSLFLLSRGFLYPAERLQPGAASQAHDRASEQDGADNLMHRVRCTDEKSHAGKAQDDEKEIKEADHGERWLGLLSQVGYAPRGSFVVT
jgi:hypothetical protein